MAEDLQLLMMEVRRALQLWTQTDYARFVGVSSKSVQRHGSSAGLALPAQREKLVRALWKTDQSLATRLAREINVDLAALGFVGPTTPSGQPRATEDHATLVAAAAADALRLSPRQVRPALAAIFSRARSLGVDLDSLSQLLAGPPA